MVVALIAAIFASLNSLGPMLPQYATRATELWQGFLHWVKSMGLGNLQDLSNAPNAAIRGVISPVFTSLGGFFTDFALIIVFLIFLLLEPPAARSSLRKKIDDSVSRYIILKSLICLFVSVFVYFTMLILQFPLALLIALLTFVLTFLPNVGPALAVLLPVPIAVLDVNISIAQDVFAILIPALVHLSGESGSNSPSPRPLSGPHAPGRTERQPPAEGRAPGLRRSSVGNLLEPRLFGKQFNLSPVILLFSLGLWFVLWGVAGAVLAIPLTSTLRIVSGYLMQNGMGLPYTAALHQILEGRPIDLGLSPEEIARARATFAPGAEEGRPSVKSEIMAQVGAVGQQGKSLVSSGVEKSSSLIEKLPFFGKKPEAEKE